MITPKVLKQHDKYIISGNLWTFNGKPFTYNDIKDEYFGFVYLIKTADGKLYIGRKNFYSEKSVVVPGKKRKKRIKVMSDWMNYFSSNEWIKEKKKNGEYIERQIISIHTKSSELNLAETTAIFVAGAMHRLHSDGTPLFYNSHVDNRYYQKNYLGMTERSIYSDINLLQI